jgi:predicted methyltransferase
MKKYLLAGLLFVLTANIVAAENALLQQSIDSEHRSTQHKKRDQFRHPQETLAFFEVEPTMTVVEIWPGGKGWYTEILAPYLKEKGTLYTAQFSATSDIAYFTKSLQAFKDKILARPDIFSNIKLSTLQPPHSLEIAPEASADRVLTFRNVHNWMKSGQAETVFNAMYNALKQGGILGIVEHRAPANSKQDPKAISGYVTEAYVIALAEKAGFKLLAKSEINANPKDTANYSEGVWALPPTLRLKEQDRDKYLAIGESDRMTLKFSKP